LFPSTILYEERVVVYESGIPSLAETERKLIMVKQGKEPIEKSLAANESLLLGQFSGATPAPAPTPTRRGRRLRRRQRRQQRHKHSRRDLEARTSRSTFSLHLRLRKISFNPPSIPISRSKRSGDEEWLQVRPVRRAQPLRRRRGERAR